MMAWPGKYLDSKPGTAIGITLPRWYQLIVYHRLWKPANRMWKHGSITTIQTVKADDQRATQFD